MVLVDITDVRFDYGGKVCTATSCQANHVKILVDLQVLVHQEPTFKVLITGTNTANLPPCALCYIIRVEASGTGSVDKISEGNTEAEVVDTGSNGHFKTLQKALKDFVLNQVDRLVF